MTIIVKLGVAYFNQGFVYIENTYSKYFGNHDEIIKVYLGSWNSTPIDGRLNRKDQNSHSPRVMMGVPFRNWVQAHYKQGDQIKIELLNPKYPNAILIR